MSTNTNRPLRNDHAAHLAQFHIAPSLLEAAGVRSVTDGEARELLGNNGHQGADLGGILFPYNHPMTSARVGARIRLDHPLPDNGGKYISEPGCRHFFFPPNVADAFQKVGVPVVIVEAEKSALALRALTDRTGIPMLPIAIGGCWGWKRKIGKRTLSNGATEPETGPSLDLGLLSWDSRNVILTFDSNTSTNRKVCSARHALAQELSHRGARVLIAEVPPREGVNGPDDLIAVAGDEVMLRTLETAQKFGESTIAQAEQTIAALEADRKADPLPVIDAVSAVGDPVRRALLISRLVALKLPGLTRKLIDQEVSQCRARAATDHKKAAEAALHGQLLAVGKTIGGAELLDAICAFVHRFVVLSKVQAWAIALWIAHTYTADGADCTPYLNINSAEKRSGKSRLLEVLAILVWNPWYTGRVTPAVLYRKIDAEAPTLLLDESDAAFKSGEEYGEALRGILNTGHRRGGKTTCCVGQGVKITYQNFSTFSPKAIAGIGKLPETVADRSISICMKRKKAGEEVERFRLREVAPQAGQLREQLEAWGIANIEKLQGARPELPKSLSDRQQDGAEPLLAIADLAGGEWPQAARVALVALCSESQVTDDSIGARLLADIREVFRGREVDKIRSAELSSELAGIETSPWHEWKRGNPITPTGVARLLKPFDICPHPVRDGNQVFKGYEIADFAEAWERYLGQDFSQKGERPDAPLSSPSNGSPAVTPVQPLFDRGSGNSPVIGPEKAVTIQECEKTASNRPGNRVTGSKAPTDRATNPIEEAL